MKTMRSAGWLTTLFLFGTLIPAASPHPLSPSRAVVEIHVSTTGRDTWPGTSTEPVASLERARDLIRAMKAKGDLPPGGVRVLVEAGHYHLRQTFDLGPQDDGAAAAPIVYEAAPGAEVELSGGVSLKDFQPVTDPGVLSRLAPEAKGHVVQADLAPQGIADPGQLHRRGYNLPMVPSGVELYFNNRPMPLARWPNVGYATIASVVGGPKDRTFTVADQSHMSRWSQEEDLWTYGYWCWDWADSDEAVETVNLAAHSLTLKAPGHVYGLKAGQRFYVFNALCELDAPGEWYVDRKRGRLYFWPPSPITPGSVGMANLETLIHAHGASHVTFNRLGMSGTRGTAVVIEDADQNIVSNCAIREVGNLAVLVKGDDSGVAGCTIWDAGDGGISLVGGDRQTLEPANLYADGNTLHDYNRWGRTYRPGIRIEGVGNRARKNLIFNAPHNAIWFAGNDHMIEENDIHDVCEETQDSGAIYTGRDWSARGTVIRHNFLHDIQGVGAYGARGVYLDDQASGIEVSGNLFYRVPHSVFVGGGRDNVVENNLFVDCLVPVTLDSRGLSDQKRDVENPDSGLRTALAKVPYRQGPYRKYKGLATTLEDNPGAPKGDRVVRNVFWKGNGLDIWQTARPYVEVEGNMQDAGASFRWPDRLLRGPSSPKDFELKADGPAAAMGFEPIPLGRIGPGTPSD